MTLSEFRRQRLSIAAAEANADLLVASLPANVKYMTGYYSIGTDVLANVQSYALFHASSGKVSIVGSVAELPSIAEVMGLDVDFYSFGGFQFAGTKGDPLTQWLDTILSSRHYPSVETALLAAVKDSQAKRVALDEMRCPTRTWHALTSGCEGVEIFEGSSVFYHARLIKHEEEIAGLEKAAEIAEASLAAALRVLAPGTTELELEQAYNEELALHGAKQLFFVATASKRAAYSDTKNTDQKIQTGDMVRFDFGCVWNGYHADLARTAVLGPPDEKLVRYYEAVKEGTQQAIACLKPGIIASEIFETAMRATRENGISHYERHHCGHGIGVECYDYPSIAPADHTVLAEGMTINVETPYYELGWGGVQLENTVVVTSDGCRYLDKSSDELIILEE